MRPSSPPRRSTHRALLVVLFGALAGLTPVVLSGGCSYSSSDTPPTTFHDLDSGDTTQIQLDTPTPEDAWTYVGKWCGAMTKCTPDDPSTCEILKPDSGADATPAPDDGDAAPETLACRVVRVGTEAPEAACAPAGSGKDSAFCTSDAECAPGFGCVGSGTTGFCYRYCCKATSPSDSICDDSHACLLLSVFARPDDKVPVCALLDKCKLLEDPKVSKCAKGSTCTVVRDKGGTTCVPIGPGGQCDDCSAQGCQANFVCVGPVSDRRCRKMCDASLGGSDCPSLRCESVPTMPAGFGICSVGGGADAGNCKPAS